MNRSPMIGVVAAAAALVIGVVAACGGGGSTPACTNGDTRQCVGTGACAGGQVCAAGAWSACDCGGTNDGGTDGAQANDGASSDGGADITPYLKNCPQVTGTPPMVEIPAQGGGSFCIDTREVTASEFDAVQTPIPGGNLKLHDDGLWPNVTDCTSGAPQPTWCKLSDRRTGTVGANCVRWCDAAAFCAKVAKRLCAAVEISSACIEKGADFPWGQDLDAGLAACSPPTPVPAAQSACHPPSAPASFVVDLVGGIHEWTSVPREETTAPHPFAPNWKFCGDVQKVTAATEEYIQIGFRCCADKK